MFLMPKGIVGSVIQIAQNRRDDRRGKAAMLRARTDFL
jgi:hypothetical protein